MRSSQNLIERLQGLDPRSAEFHTAVAGHFRRLIRSNYNYGWFMMLWSTGSAALMCIHWGRWLFVLASLAGFLLTGLLGCLMISATAGLGQLLHNLERDEDPESRLERLRQVASTFPGDDIGTLVLRTSETHDQKVGDQI